ncbi:hypothetical protein E1A91_D13G183100v1 [Gossypium mustelinum]|uniref:Uncharacterized protein n=1 Tax=Gossypium mustelinum TaxID=34275 RepID=A0A5D2S3U4_GOSMU|nr:hypothetical protein E1A91_D13G183100v1 [Gossypium mustelinum]
MIKILLLVLLRILIDMFCYFCSTIGSHLEIHARINGSWRRISYSVLQLVLKKTISCMS